MTNKYISNDDKNVNRYFKDVEKYSILSNDDEKILLERIKLGDDKAAEELIKHNLRFVVSVAKNYQNRGIPISDLINEGNLGLIKAAKNYKIDKGVKFISYAVWWIRQSILLNIYEEGRTIRIPINRIKVIRDNDNKSLDDTINNITPEYAPKSISLSSLINGGDTEILDLVEDNIETNIFEDDTVTNCLNNILASLDIREREIIELYYGLNNIENPITLDLIGERFGLTKERVRQIKENAIRKLRHNSYDLYKLIYKDY